MSFIKSKLQTAINNNMKNTFKTLLFISLLCGVSGADEIKSVMEGDSVTLQTDENKILTYYQLTWRFGVDLIAEISKGKISLYVDVADGRFRGRLKLDNLTGSLTITNIRTNHSGAYKIEISTNTGTIEKTFNLTVNDQPLSAGAKAGINVEVFAVLMIMIVVVIYDRHRTSELERLKEEQERLNDKWRTVLVMMGESVPLITDDAHIKTDKVTVYHEQSPIAEISGGKITQVYDQISERYEPNHQTGSLIITDSRRSDSGLYELKIINSTKEITYKTIIVTVVDEVIRKIVMKGNSVYLSSDVTELQKDAEVEWKFKNTVIENIVIAKKKQKDKMISLHQDAHKFKQNLKVAQTGSLSIKNSRMNQSGDYELNITSSRITVHKIFKVYVSAPSRAVTIDEVNEAVRLMMK